MWGRRSIDDRDQILDLRRVSRPNRNAVERSFRALDIHQELTERVSPQPPIALVALE
jgi:hypothetical protein